MSSSRELVALNWRETSLQESRTVIIVLPFVLKRLGGTPGCMTNTPSVNTRRAWSG